MMHGFLRCSAPAILLGCFLAAGSARANDKIIFSRDIHPLLSANCFACHGPDDKARKGHLRLDTRAGAFKVHDGKAPIVPGDLAKSELIRRLTTADEDDHMPPPDSGKKLTPAQIEIMKAWIAQGADYTGHWSFEPIKSPPVPAIGNRESAIEHQGNPIDHFIESRLEKEGLRLSPQADRPTLIRRVTLDLTGLPPTLAEIDAFLKDTSPDAYEKVVDRLLASPRYGERMALDWLDAARFADTHGYHIDAGRDMTRWREWVIDAFNRNQPFDQFTIWQLAGDLLPHATLEQQIASGFNRNHMINFEGGAIPQEYHTAYLVDEVNTTATVWLGLTVACAQCHDHKFDPIRQKDYYQLFAFFNNVPEKGLDGNKGNAVPFIKTPTRGQQQQLDQLAREIKELQSPAPASSAPTDKRAAAHLASLKKQLAALEASQRTTMVMREMDKPRDTFILARGQYDKPGEKVSADTPAFLPPLPRDAPHNRLGLARWLVSPQQPLTARVTVNRYWQMYFGTGIVKTTGDFGSQGEWPSHPELLDYLAARFVQSGWDVKAMQRLIVTSAAYRQSSKASSELIARDPENRLLARGPRFRLPAEFIRDQALAISGLLCGDIGGESVFPYQPAGLWEELMSREDGKNWSAQTYVQSHGKDLYRRTMYTFWKRASPPPTLSAFDAPDRDVCTVRRSRTNTPLQALILLNDPTYLEASRKLAERILSESGPGIDQRIDFAFRLATARMPTPAELALLHRSFDRQAARYRAKPELAEKLLKEGESPVNPRLDKSELAAWSMVASIILNLDETMTKN